jgi:Ca-activated chloride channel family protein
MAWKHPEVLWGLPALAAMAALYLRVSLRAPRRGAVAFPLWLVADAAAHAARVRRHLAAALLLLTLAAAIIGAAGPIVAWPAPTGWPIVLIIDVSRSMEEHDILPSRIEATKTAALAFVDGLPRSTRAALVSFGNYATLVVPLTTDRDRLREGIRNLHTQLRTQLGTGLMEGVQAVTGEGANGASGALPPVSPSPPLRDQPRAIAVLMSDGRASDGVPPLEAAAEARRRGVRVYTVGVGTTADPSQLRSGYWGVLDELTLRAIAEETGGRYFHASAADRLREVYREIARTVAWQRRPTEVAAIVAGLTMLLLVASVAVRTRLYLP